MIDADGDEGRSEAVAQSMLKHIRSAIAQLSPDEIQARAERPVRILLQAASPASAAAVENYLSGGKLGPARLAEARSLLLREEDAEPGARFHVVAFEAGLRPPPNWRVGYDTFEFRPDRPELLVSDLLAGREDLSLALARRFSPFRDRVTKDIIQRVSGENAMFAIMSALPNVIPSLAEIPWAFGEFASDTAVLTVNQIRMAFQLAAASDHAVGFSEQRSEIGSLVAGAFGWRSLAREFSGKIPFGGGLLPKAAIAYAGTWVAGASLERLYRMGYGLTRQERKRASDEAFTRGREVASQLMARVKRRKDAKPEPVEAPIQSAKYE
jgi:hypothetical protein